jgi:hypothetical protein
VTEPNPYEPPQSPADAPAAESRIAPGCFFAAFSLFAFFFIPALDTHRMIAVFMLLPIPVGIVTFFLCRRWGCLFWAGGAAVAGLLPYAWIVSYL